MLYVINAEWSCKHIYTLKAACIDLWVIW